MSSTQTKSPSGWLSYPTKSRPWVHCTPAHLPRPAAHIWRLRSGIADDHRLDDHFEALLTKLVGSAERVRALIEGAEVGGEFVIGRYFEPGPEEERIVEPGRQIGDFERLRGSTPCLTSSHARTGRLRCARRPEITPIRPFPDTLEFRFWNLHNSQLWRAEGKQKCRFGNVGLVTRKSDGYESPLAPLKRWSARLAHKGTRV